MDRAVFDGSHSQLRELLKRVPGILGGAVPTSLTREFQTRIGMAALARIKDDFVTKARRGTGTDGISWPYLSKKYLAYGRRVSEKEKRNLGVTPAMKYRGLLTKAQDKKWRQVFVRNMKRLEKEGYDDRQAKAIASRIAWAAVKKMGARTKLDVYGGRQYLEILRDEGIMLDMLSPGVKDGQIFEVEADRVRVGISGPKAVHHYGNPAKGLPQRALWPTAGVGTMSAKWWEPMLRAAVTGVQQMITRLTR